VKPHRIARAFDQRTAAEAFAAPGMDTRSWVSIGIVSADTPEEVVDFDESAGQPFVRVLLEPSKVPVYARVSNSLAGNGEGEWNPFIQGDEVLVVFPQGYEDAGAVIVGRLNNSFDPFPTESVAGQDPTTNTFAFRRRRTPFVEEYAGPVLFRTALSEAFFSIDATGAVTIRDGEGDALQMTADLFGFQNAAGDILLQMNLTEGIAIMQARDAYFQIASAESGAPSSLLIPTSFSVTTAGDTALEHVATTEGVINLLKNFLTVWGAALNLIPAPLTGTSLAATILPPAQEALLTGTIGGAVVPATGTLSPAVLSALTAAFTAQPQKQFTATGQPLPGVGCKGFLAG